MLDNVEQKPPSPEPATPPAGEPKPAFAPVPEEPPETGGWWTRLWSTRGHHDAVPESSPEDGRNEPPAPIASNIVSLTEEELNQRVQRGAQSLHDQEVARRNREASEVERRRLRDEDPYGFAQKDRDDEELQKQRAAQTQQLLGLLGHVGRQHDAFTVDPVLETLPEPERQRILALPNAGQGLPGRKLIVDEALKTYGRLEYDRGFREAQAKLRRDPAFRKSVLHEFRGSFEEPELYPGQAPSEVPEDNVSNRLRSAFFSR